MTTPPIMTINDELLAELESIHQDASDLTPDSDAQEYLGNLAARVISERAALLQHVRELAEDSDRLDWVLDHAEVDRHGISLPCGPSRKLDKESSKAAIDAARSSADKGADQ